MAFSDFLKRKKEVTFSQIESLNKPQITIRTISNCNCNYNCCYNYVVSQNLKMEVTSFMNAPKSVSH